MNRTTDLRRPDHFCIPSIEMRTSLKQKIRFFVTFQLVSGLIGSLVGVPKYYGTIDNMWPVLAKGFLLGFIGSGILIWLDQVYFESKLKRLSLMKSVLIKSLTYLLAIVALFLTISLLFRPLLPEQTQLSMIGPTVLVTFAFIFFGTSVMGINRLLGGSVLLNLLSGKYHKPMEEERIFMFMDIVSSTSIAEKLGNFRFYEFLNDFFCDISEEIIERKGDIYKYVGDEAIIVWKMQPGGGNQECLQCYYSIADRIQSKEREYLDKYGFAPSFRVGMHCGHVVVGEMGAHRREIVFLGDVVNTAARIQGECKQVGKNILISKALLQKISLPEGVYSELIGKVSLKGKEEMMELFEIKRRP